MLASVSEGSTRIKNLLMAEDIKRTMEAFRAMGVEMSIRRKAAQVNVIVHGVGMHGLKKPAKPLYLGNSGTTMRILPGILAGQDFEVVLEGDNSLSKRPMQRITAPLKKMGVDIEGQRAKGISRLRSGQVGHRAEEIRAPLKIHGGELKAIKYNSKIASAQVKSCILLAGLFADGVTSVDEPEKSRDHTERMLAIFGCKVKSEGRKVSLKGPVCLRSPGVIEIPGDISSAAFFIVAGCISPDAKIIIKNVGLNPTRIGILDILKKMGADVSLKFKINPLFLLGQKGLKPEPAGDIIVKSSRLKGVMISPKEVTRAIDEIPVIMVAACFAKGRTIIKGIKELRVKETDRVKSMVMNLHKMGADIKVKDESIVINGGRLLHSANVSSFGDHRTAMSILVAGLGAKGEVIVTGLDCINKSFPNFLDILNKLN